MEKNLTYEEAYRELQKITEDIENESVSVDDLAAKVKRASELIRICQDKLKNAETEVSNIIKNMETGS
ncbi:MAG: exodeoxyribonuclease VII small subunit [Chitinophagaceae bacterium]|nr:MAG: exodeoxyribonuclease VII small subunit [Chitinophagaceae bacterium]